MKRNVKVDLTVLVTTAEGGVEVILSQQMKEVRVVKRIW